MTTETQTSTAGYAYDKQAVVRRLARIEGQVRGLQGMIDEEAYCIDVLTQIGAVSKALDGVARKVLEDHAHHCVRDAVEQGGTQADEKIEELLAAIERYSRTH